MSNEDGKQLTMALGELHLVDLCGRERDNAGETRSRGKSGMKRSSGMYRAIEYIHADCTVFFSKASDPTTPRIRILMPTRRTSTRILTDRRIIDNLPGLDWNPFVPR